MLSAAQDRKNNMSSKEFVKYIEEILDKFGHIKIKPMFGGYGVYKSDLIFAIIVIVSFISRLD